MQDLIERLRALHVWPQSTADEYADTLTPRRIAALYEVGKVAHEAAEALTTAQAEIEALKERAKQAEDGWTNTVNELAAMRATVQRQHNDLQAHKDALAQSEGNMNTRQTVPMSKEGLVMLGELLTALENLTNAAGATRNFASPMFLQDAQRLLASYDDIENPVYSTVKAQNDRAQVWKQELAVSKREQERFRKVLNMFVGCARYQSDMCGNHRFLGWNQGDLRRAEAEARATLSGVSALPDYDPLDYRECGSKP